jgi:hypothetical protein
MRSTLLFVAVLLACTPVHAQATAPPEAPILNAWLTALLPAPTAEATRKVIARRRNSIPRPLWNSPTPQSQSPIADYLPSKDSATLLTHDSNAP